MIDNVIWELAPHTKAKHQILSHYLDAWFAILGSCKERIVFIDGFCGPGKYKNGEKGSPIIALQSALKATSNKNSEMNFLFIEEDEARISNLKSEIEKLDLPKNFNVRCINGSFNEEVSPLLDRIEKENKNLAPAFVFIDPFGFKGIPFKTVSRLLKNRSCEIFINIMVDSINRFLVHYDQKVTQHITDAFGTDEAIELEKNSTNRVNDLRNLYKKQLENEAQFVREFEMRNDKNRVIFYLFFATNNSLGHTKMKESMWKIDESGEFTFSDAIDPNQLKLFGSGPSKVQVANVIVKKFSNQKNITGGAIQKFILEETNYLNKHKSSALKYLEETGTISVNPIKLNGTKRKNGYPPDVIVNFNQ